MNPVARCCVMLIAAVAAAAPVTAAAPAAPPPPETTQAAPVAASPALTERIGELVAILNGTGDYDAYFASVFQTQVPKAAFAGVVAQLVQSAGPLERIESVTPVSPYAAMIVIGFRDGLAAGRIVVDPAAPHQVTGLFVEGVTAREKTLGEIGAALDALPGRTGFALARLGDGPPTWIARSHADDGFAVGSAFKLVVLAELVRAIKAGDKHWQDVVTLDGLAGSGGAYSTAPAGTRVTYRELAEKMISVSDNSAADILLKALGRSKVEAMLPMLGVADPARDRPFLSTVEMFKLKGSQGGAVAARYLALAPVARSAMLDGEVASLPVSAIDPMLFKDGKPVLIDHLEWFFTPADMVRIMDWIRRHSTTGAATEARTILGINSGIGASAASAWKYVGYKGGSEPGVINMTLLLQGKDGAWYALTASSNDPAHDIQLARFAGLVTRAASLAAPR
jgi:beta-lactamase class A